MKKTLAVVAAVATTLVVASCGSTGDSGSTKAWTFTDDIGTEISLDAVPERIIAHKDSAAALADMGLGDRVVGVFGDADNPNPEIGLQSPNLDLDSVEDVTGDGEYGQIDLEKVAELDPDLFVTTTFGGGQLWHIDDAVKEKLAGRYDVAAINLEGESVDGIIENAERLALALGADETDFEEGHEALETAEERAKTVAADAGDPSILVVAPADDTLYVANVPAYGDLAYLRDEVGLDIVSPEESEVDEGGYWQLLSWENADAYDVDVAMWDARGGDGNLDLLESQPVWSKVSAAQDDAYLPWRNEVAPSARGYATLLDQFADDLAQLGT